MQIAQELAGYTLGGADLLRRAMGKKKASEMAKQRSVFVDGALANGVDKDRATLAWTRGFVAADHVQRAIIAAEQSTRLIHLSFVSDLPWLTMKLARAGAGISAWSGAVRQEPRSGRVPERYPLFFALRQLMGHLDGYRTVRRVPTGDAAARIYRIEHSAGVRWIAWRDPAGVLLPQDGEPTLAIDLEVGRPTVELEPVITRLGVEEATRRRVRTDEGRVRLDLSHTPMYVLPVPD